MKFLFGLFACFLCVNLTLSIENTYKAAVVLKKETDLTSYVPYISDAGKSRVDIIVIPSPELAKTDNYDKAVKTLSSAAKHNRLYVVAHLLKSLKCQKVDVIVRNSLIFDRDGAVISSYSKPADNVPNCTTSEPGLQTFTTDFGTTFGVLMEEDLVLQNVEMMKGLKNFVVVGQFASEMSILSAPNLAPSWAFTTDGNLISSAGIYAGKSGSAGVGSKNMTVAELNIDGRSDAQVRPPTVSPSKIQTFPGEDLSQYTIRPLNLEDSNRGYKETVCHGSFCCDFDVKTRFVGSTQSSLSYGLAVFNGVRQFGGSNNIGVQTCSVVACAGLYKQSCSIGSTIDNNDVHFDKLSVAANFTGFSSAQFPIIVSAEPSTFKFDSQTANDNKRVFVQIENTQNLWSFVIFGRVYGLDPEDTFGYKNGNNTEAVNLDIYEYIFSEDVIEFFDYLWIRLRILFVVVSIYFLEMM